jgi:hypothetical protein
MTTDFPTGASQEPVACCDTAFSCLLRLGARSGVMTDIEAARCRSVVDEDTLPVSRLIELADELGLKAEQAQLDWQGLQVVGQSHPILVLLKDANVVIVTPSERGEAKDIAVWDPLNRHAKILFVPREDFEKAWTGHALIITNQGANTPATAAFAGFCWYTSAGLELLGKAGTRGQLSNPPNRPLEVSESGRKQQPSVISDMRAGPTSAPAGTAKAQSSSAPMRIAQSPSPEAARRADTGWLSVLARLSLAAAGIAAVVGIGGFLLRGGAIDMVRAAVTRATQLPVSPTKTVLPPQAAAIPPAAPAAEDAGTPNFSPAAMAPPAPARATAPTVAASFDEVGPRAAAQPAGPLPAAAASAATAPEAASDEVGPRAPAPPSGPQPTAASSAATAPEAASDEVGPRAAAAEPATEASSTAALAPAASSQTAAASIAGSAAETPDGAATAAARLPATPPAGPQLSAAELAALLARGDALLSIGDIASARLFYERAANAGDALAAVRLGETFDPGFLARAHLRAVQPDSRVAVSWYRRARDLGVADAEILLKSLESK